MAMWQGIQRRNPTWHNCSIRCCWSMRNTQNTQTTQTTQTTWNSRWVGFVTFSVVSYSLDTAKSRVPNWFTLQTTPIGTGANQWPGIAVARAQSGIHCQGPGLMGKSVNLQDLQHSKCNRGIGCRWSESAYQWWEGWEGKIAILAMDNRKTQTCM